MAADETPPKSPSTAATKACRSIDDHRCTLRALLRLVDPESPFQPIVLSSIDVVGWLALFGRAAQQLGKSLRKIPNAKCRNAALDASKQFVRLAATLCEDAELHTFPPVASHPNGVPEIPSFSPTSAMCAEDAAAIDGALDTASRAFTASAKHRQLICRTLGLAAAKLKSQLYGPNGLLRLIKRHCRSSRPLRRRYAKLADGLKAALAALPDPESTPWKECQNKFATVRYQLETHLISELGTLVKHLRTPTSTGAKKPEAVKTATLRAVTAFLEAHGLARSLDAGLLAVQYHSLFCGLLAPVDATLKHCGCLRGRPSNTQRLIDDIRQLSLEVIKGDVRASWDTSLPDTDSYTTEVVLAALHHLERPSDARDESATPDQRIFGVSDGNLALWVRGGDYVGADPLAEVSHRRAAEEKRVDRTLQHLRRVGAAFHDRRQWTPTDFRNARSTQHRLWTVNPLLALLPRIAARLEIGTSSAGTGQASTSPGSRPRPTRRNRGTRPRSQD